MTTQLHIVQSKLFGGRGWERRNHLATSRKPKLLSYKIFPHLPQQVTIPKILLLCKPDIYIYICINFFIIIHTNNSHESKHQNFEARISSFECPPKWNCIMIIVVLDLPNAQINPMTQQANLKTLILAYLQAR